MLESIMDIIPPVANDAINFLFWFIFNKDNNLFVTKPTNTPPARVKVLNMVVASSRFSA